MPVVVDLILEIVNPGQPRAAGYAPAAFTHDLLCHSPIIAVQPVDVDHAIEVIMLVLQDSRQPALRFELVSLTVEIGCAHEHPM